MNVSSIVVKTTTDRLQEVMDTINTYKLCEVHFYDSEGRIVATIEGDSIDEQMKRLREIQAIPFVFSASLAYSYCADELKRALGEIKGH